MDIQPGGNEILEEMVYHLAMLRRLEVELNDSLQLEHVLDTGVEAALRMSGASSLLLAIEVDQGFERGLAIQRLSGDYTQDQLSGRDFASFPLIQTATRTLRAASDTGATGTVSAFPLISRGSCVGVLQLAWSIPPEAAAHGRLVEFLKLMCSHLAIAVSNAQTIRRMQRLLEDLDAFAHMAAHDLRSPLQIVMGYAYLLKQEIDETQARPEWAHMAEQIIQMGSAMGGIIEDLLLLAKTDDLSAIHPEVTDISVSVREALGRLEMLIANTSAEIRSPDVWPAVTTYRPWLTGILTNLIGNGIKYGGRPPLVSLTFEERDGALRILVSDNGKGMTTEQASRLFAPYSRLAEHADIQGTGLGLTIVKRLVERMGGSAGVDGCPEQGSTFWFDIPAISAGHTPEG